MTTHSEQDSKAERAASVKRQLSGETPPTAEPQIVDASSSPAAGTSDVGESTSRRGEEMVDRDGKEAGRIDLGVDEDTGRPVGTSTKRDVTGINP